MPRCLPVLLLLTLCVSPAWSGDAVSTAEGLAASVLEADAGALKVLAARENPDPWAVADLLLAGGHRAEALAFARAAPRKAVERLATYVEGAPTPAALAGDRDAAESARKALAEEDPKAARRHLAERPEHPNTLVAVAIHRLRGETLEALVRYPEAAAAYREAADRARELGWFAGESDGLYRAGLAHWSHADFAGALAMYERRLDVETTLGSKVGMGRAHFGISAVHSAIGRHDEEAEHRRRAAALAREIDDHEYISKAISHSALELSRKNDPEGCLALAAKALAALDRIDGSRLAARFQPDPGKIASSRTATLLNCASWSAMLSDIDTARRYARAAIDGAGTAGNAVMRRDARAHLATLEGVWHERGNEDLLALTDFEQARSLYKKNRNRLRLADTLRRMASINGRLGNFPTGLARVRDALVVLEEIGARHELQRAHRRAASLSSSANRLEDALHHGLEALRLARLLKDLEAEASALSGLATVRRLNGDIAGALDLLREAMRIEARTHRGRNAGVYLSQMAGLQKTLENHAEALRLYDEAEAALRRADDRHNLFLVLADRASILAGRRDFAGATAALSDVLEDPKTAENPFAHALTLARLADIRFMQGRFADAVAHREKALGLYVGARNQPRILETRAQLGRERYFAGDKARALDDLADAQEAAEESGEARMLAYCALGLAEAHLFSKNHAVAARWARRGVEAMASMGLHLDEEGGAGLRSKFHALPAIGATAALMTGNLEDAYYFLESGRASTLLAALGGRGALREVTVPVVLRREEEAALAAEAMAKAAYELAQRQGDLSVVRVRKQEWRGAQEHVKEVVETIQRTVRRQADLVYSAPAGLAATQASLRPDEALVVYGDTLDHAIALVVTSASVRAVDLGEAQPIADAVQAIIGDQDNPLALLSVKALQDRVIAPLKLPETVTRLLISPDGRLSYAPFGLLVADRSVTLVPSGTAYGMLRDLPRTAGQEVLALGNPDYGGPVRTVGPSSLATNLLRGGQLTALPGSAIEARNVGDVVLLGSKASETGFRAVVGREEGTWRAVHLACHGLVDPQRPTLSALALTPDAQNDGFVTALDLFRMRVPAELVVLSGCETGRGKVVAGEGILGLARAFMFAGAPRVLVSLWKVDDQATRALMTKFYELWNPKDRSQAVPAAAALLRAQQHVKSQPRWAHPRYWAAWVLWGLPD